ncbi:hypothetical protein [Maricaulis maris]|uniref:Secreted protein n=1 Tax=Maricaulis maris TaxID=74318 RepID=A0A495DLZ5_9PROT|nr:hypothetical protein [Maricaulis maris]RKR03945.1 hypothetical protein C7435_0388 [Maricaulis maris]
MKTAKTRIGIALLALFGSVAATGAASAGTWHLNAAACPDLREDRIDARRTDSRFDRREDIRDRSVIECPPRAWSYQPDRYERDRRYIGIAAQPASPGVVYVARNGAYYVRGYRGETRWIDVAIHYPREYRGRRFGPDRFDHPRDRRDPRRGSALRH